MEYRQEDFIELSGIQHFAFCRRQWALIHIDRLWEENLRTTEGGLLHDICHDAEFTESRRSLITTRAMPVFSATMGISGQCDIVEFRREKDGISLVGKEGKFSVFPVEYKHGEPKSGDEDILQLTAQAMCLEEMLVCEVTCGALYYAKTKRRESIEFTQEHRARVREMFREMHELIDRGYTPKVKPRKNCSACSLYELCMPGILGKTNVKAYIRAGIEKDT